MEKTLILGTNLIVNLLILPLNTNTFIEMGLKLFHISLRNCLRKIN